ncbi:MAG: hypothetical protein KC731_31925 [Myxococcales bacterium]|nr:hypothetical protein [Myxococcales bacterium]
MRSLLTLFFSLGATTLLFMACGTDPAPTESICDPGSNVFCRCRGSRESGTKRCNDAGDGFGPCENSYGECDEVEGTGTGGSSGVGPGTGGTPDPGELLAPCNVEMDQLCDEGLVCEHGYCTKPCESYEECLPLGDCVDLDGKGGRCAPLCVEQADCEIYGSAVACGFTDAALPPFDVVVCADWGDSLALPPDGYACSSDTQCNLGFEGTELVCDGPEGCAEGCHVDTDCSDDQASCSSSGQDLGTCGGGMGEDIDICPGKSVSLSAAMTTSSLMGDTSAAPPPSEANSASFNCDSLSATEEDIYHLTVADAGDVIVLVTPAMGYDTILYVRTGTCDTGDELVCADDEGAGSELMTFTAAAGQEFWVFVDGFNGSTGSYQIDFDLTPM